MAGSTISTLVTISVTLASAPYPSPLTITSAGAIKPFAADGAAGLIATFNGGSVLNKGAITGAYGTFYGGYGGPGGTGVDLTGGSLTNKGSITGGSGGPVGGIGGFGVYLTSGKLTNEGGITGGSGAGGGPGVAAISSTLINNGTIAGGTGGFIFGGRAVILTSSSLINNGVIIGGGERSGGGGDGVDSYRSNVTNNGAIAGGSGGSLIGYHYARPGGTGARVTSGSRSNIGTITGGSSKDGADGGTGVEVISASLTNDGTIAGGSGGNGLFSIRPISGVGGFGVVVTGGSLTNHGTINGGHGGSFYYYDYETAASGGIGVGCASSILTNDGTIAGGSGGRAARFAAGGGGGSGVALGAGSTLINNAGIIGGSGGFQVGYDFLSFAASGTGVVASSSNMTNNGTIAGGAGGFGGSGGSGVDATNSFLTNNATITGGYDGSSTGNGVDVTSSTLINDGIIGGSIGVGATDSLLTNNGTITGSRDGGGLYGGTGVDATNSLLTNNGTIVGGSASDSRSAGIGVLFHGGGTLTDGGFIGGGIGPSATADAVEFGSGASRLILKPGASFSGGVVADVAFSNVLELASAASTGTIAGLGDSIIGFGQITVDAGARWRLAGSNTIASGASLTVQDGASLTGTGALENDGAITLDPSTLTVGSLIGTGSITIGAGSTLEARATVSSGETIRFAGRKAYLHFDKPGGVAGHVTNFDLGETIDLKGVDPASVTFQDGQLSFTGGSFSLALASTDMVTATASVDGAAVALLLCFCADTLIQTPAGERRVQDLAVGDDVTTLSGAKRRIVWIGTGTVPATRGQRTAATPVIVRKDALAENVPNRDLRLTKGHALYLDGVLIPVEYLVNHRTIEWDDCTQEVELYHIELTTHDVLIANGAPAESYRDEGNRWLFDNANSGWDAVPKEPFAPVLTGGPVVERLWRQLLERGGMRPVVPLTHDPDLHLEVDGHRVDAVSSHGDAVIFALTGSRREVRVVSRAAPPDVLGVARDPRVLGVALRQIVLRQGARFQTIKARDVRLAKGFHAFETENGWRWTDGNAVMPGSMLERLVGPMELVLHVGCTSSYPIGA